jgi:hypothetical protein
MADESLYVVTVTDQLLSVLVGHEGCHYESPPQDEQPVNLDQLPLNHPHQQNEQPNKALRAASDIYQEQALRSQAMSVRKLIPIKITLDEACERSETRLASAGAYALVLSSVLPDRAIELHSTYLGHSGAPTQASHLLLSPAHNDSETVEHDEFSIPVMVARRRCIYDHLQRLQDFLGELGHTAQIPLADDALLAIEL